MTTLILIFVSLALVAYAAICNAKMDTVKDHYSTSIYSDATKYDPTWYNPTISWQDKDLPKDKEATLQVQHLPFWADLIAKIKPGWDPISDFWHWQKTQMLLSLIGAIAVVLLSSWDFESHVVLYQRILASVLYFIVAGVQWNLFFNYFYNHKLKK